MLELEDAPRTGGAGFVDFEPVTADEIMQVLAQKVPCDRNGCDAEYWRSQLDDLDYFTTQTAQMERQVLMTLAANPCAGNRQAVEYLEYMVGQVIGGEE